MKIYKTNSGNVIEHQEAYHLFPSTNWDQFINRDNLHQLLSSEIQSNTKLVSLEWLNEQAMLAPIDQQEIWAAGVTYLRSRHARVEESKDSGGGTFYDKVYDAPRPEIFFKATSQRTVGQNGLVRIRKDSTWDVPEPELTLFQSMVL